MERSNTDNSKYKIVKADISEAIEIGRLINDAYWMETGDTGVAFLNCPRLVDPLPPYLQSAYREGRLLKAINSDDELCAIICYQLLDDAIYFGPFAVQPKLKGTGVGRLLMNEVYRIGRDHGFNFCEISVIDLRTDIIPMYERMGYIPTGEVRPFPRPEELTRPANLILYRKDISVTPVIPVVPPPAVVPAAAAAPPVPSLFMKKSIFAKDTPKPVEHDPSRSPWASINDMLVQNRCWLCEQVFPRGKQKKVFQLSNLLQYYTERLQAEDGITTTDGTTSSEGEKMDIVNDNGNSSSSAAVTEIPSLTCKNFKNCYDSFAKFMREDPLGEKKKMKDEFAANDVEVWMSGLACGLNPDCRRDLALFIDLKPSYGNSSSSNSDGTVFMKVGPDGKECPPGCGCDNPWPFLS